MELTPSQIRYLMAIYQLGGEGMVRSSDIADSLDVARPSVHRMTTQLSERKLIEKEKYSLIRVTEKGRSLAGRYQQVYLCISGLLNDHIDLPDESVSQGAIEIISSLSAEKLEATCAQIGESIQKSAKRKGGAEHSRSALLVYHDLIEGIVTAMDARDPYTASHSERVSDIALWICQIMNLSEDITEAVHIAAHVHDIGKIGVPDSVLLKSSALCEEEWNVMKSHSEIGSHILERVAGFSEVSIIVRHHHERWDGKGYPIGLSAQRIPLGSRVIALADSIDAMLSNRKYRAAMSLGRCKMEIERNAGIMYDPSIAEKVIQNWADLERVYASQT